MESQVAENPLNKCSLVIREMQIRTTLIFHLHLSEWLMPVTQVTVHAGKDLQQGSKGTLLIAGRKVNLYRKYQNQHGSSSESWELIYHKVQLYRYFWDYTQRMF